MSSQLSATAPRRRTTSKHAVPRRAASTGDLGVKGSEEAGSHASNGSTGDAIRVAVRVRPFNKRERDTGSKCIVSMQGATTTVDHPTKKKSKSFTFDDSLWSFDGYTVAQDNGYLEPLPSSAYIDQELLFERLGRPLVDNVMEGYNATAFAYGQTGSGKSYSMLGSGANSGLVPRICYVLLKRISELGDQVDCKITMSMLEVYNERIRDLLSVDGTSTNLKIRQSPSAGFFVEGLSKAAVSSFQDVAQRVTSGILVRTTASTNLNETSSRSHMVMTLNLSQVDRNTNTTKTSTVHLVDLAGSERAEAAGSQGDRLREGSSINKSLHTLGNVISALAEGNPHVPYRNSVLTRLLHQSLGGNSKTVMLATIGPAAVNYEETVATLRYADRAKKIRNVPVINESPTEKLIRELKEENARLLAMLSKGGLSTELEAQLRANEEEVNSRMNILESSWQQRLSDAKQQWQDQQDMLPAPATDFNTSSPQPFLTNVNQDAQLSGVIRHLIVSGKSLVCKAASSEDSSEHQSKYQGIICLSGPTIQTEHALLVCDGTSSRVTLEALPGAQVLHNGKLLPARTQVELQHGDRLAFGPSQLYVFCEANSSPSSVDLDADAIQMEIAAANGVDNLIEGRVSSAASTTTSTQQIILRQELLLLHPLVVEMNAMCMEMDRPLRFDLVVAPGAAHDPRDESKTLMVRVSNIENGYIWMWDKAKFLNRKYLVQDLYYAWLDGGPAVVDKEKDPLWDPPEDVFLGSAHIYLDPLAYGLPINETVSINNYQGVEEGTLKVEFSQCNADGESLEASDDMASSPEELVGKRLDIMIKLVEVRGLRWIQEDDTRGVRCCYRFYTDTKMRSTKSFYGKDTVQLRYTKQFTLRAASQSFVNFLTSSPVVVEVWGKQGQGQRPPSTLRSAAPSFLTDTMRSTSARSTNFDTDDDGRASALSPRSLGATPLPSADTTADAQMELVVRESEWLQQKRKLEEQIAHLQEEVQFLNIEKGVLEKQVTRMDTITESSVKHESELAHPLFVHFQEFIAAEDAINSAESNPDDRQVLMEHLDDTAAQFSEAIHQRVQRIKQHQQQRQ